MQMAMQNEINERDVWPLEETSGRLECEVETRQVEMHALNVQKKTSELDDGKTSEVIGW